MVLKFLMGMDTYTGNLRYAIDMCMGMSGEATTSRDITLSFSIGRKETRVLLGCYQRNSVNVRHGIKIEFCGGKLKAVANPSKELYRAPARHF